VSGRSLARQRWQSAPARLPRQSAPARQPRQSAPARLRLHPKPTWRRERPAGSELDIDRGTPALTLKVGQYPVHSGGVGAIRTLGRLGVPVYAITEFGLTPAGASRYCAGRFAWRATGAERPEQLVADLRDVGARIGRRSVVIPVDDEAAILIAEHQAELAEFFAFPRVRPELPRRLASKTGLHELCASHDVPSPATVTPASLAEVSAFAATATFPVVVKNAEAWVRRRHPVVPGTTVLNSVEELLALVQPTGSAGGSGPDPSPGAAHNFIVQEYLPPECSQDWIVQLYCDAESNCAVLFTGQKVRSWPPQAGVTACAYSIANAEVAAIAERFCREIGFRGIADLDWRFDRRDGQYKLVDFNPRIGNQFRLFETPDGVDVVRAMHLDLTGRAVPPGRQIENRRIIVEHVDLPARLAYRRIGRGAGAGQIARPEGQPGRAEGHSGRAGGQPARADQVPVTTELAWLAADDPLPFVAMLCRLAGPAVAGLPRLLRPAAGPAPARGGARRARRPARHASSDRLTRGETSADLSHSSR
jgi:D-aspartate ligase